MNTFRKIVVLMGGVSSERAVSLNSGKNVLEALQSLGRCEVLPMTLDRESIADLPACDAVFLALHGGYGENGGVQADLDARGISYTGPGAEASRVAMDKIATKRKFDAAGVPTAAWAVVEAGETKCPLPFPVVAKPPCDGSSVGISKATNEVEWQAALAAARQAGGDRVLVERYIPGRETTIGILDGEVLPVIEIRAKDSWYGWDEKYNSNETQYPVLTDDASAGFPAGTLARMCAAAKAAYDTLGCRGVSRVDFRVTEDGEPFALEVNTVPGFTSHSLVPKAAAARGLSFPEMCARILECARHD